MGGGTEVLKVYLATWYQFHCPGKTVKPTDDDNEQELEPELEISVMLNYWPKVSLCGGKDPSEQQEMWLYALSWPRCWCEIDTEGDGLISDFSALRRHCPNFRGYVQIQSFEDRDLGNMPASVRPVDIAACGNLVDSAFQHLSNLTWLNMTACTQSTITDSAFQHLSKVKSLMMGMCNQSTITDSAFQHLSNLQSLDMMWCYQSTITDSAFQHLSNLTSLNMTSCRQSTITNSAFKHLLTLKSLDLSRCTQLTITDSAFQHLSNLTSLIERDNIS